VANSKAANLRKGAHNSSKTHCIQGHTLADARVFYQNGWIKRDCRTCWKIRAQLGGIIKPEALAKLKVALTNGASVAQITKGIPIGGGPLNRSLKIVDPSAFYRHRRENPEFDRFVTEAITDSNSVGRQIRHRRNRTRAQIEARREEANDYQKIRSMLPAYCSDRDEIVSRIFEDLLSGALQRTEVRLRMKDYIAAHNRMFPTNFARRQPIAVTRCSLFEHGAMTLGDTISRGLWD
jgi:hypothetical protein